MEAWGLLDIQIAQSNMKICFYAFCDNATVVSGIVSNLQEGVEGCIACGGCEWCTSQYNTLSVDCGIVICSHESSNNYFSTSPDSSILCQQSYSNAVVVDRGSVFGVSATYDTEDTVPTIVDMYIYSVSEPNYMPVIVQAPSVTVQVVVYTTDVPGVVYCAARKVETGPPVSVYAMRSSFFFHIDPISSRVVRLITIDGLESHANYNIYCYAEDANGRTSPLRASVENSISVRPEYCKNVYFHGNSFQGMAELQSYQSLQQDALESLAIRFTVSSPPLAHAQALLTFYDSVTSVVAANVFTSPPVLTLSNGDDTTRSFLAFGAVGRYKMKLAITSPTFGEYCSADVTAELVIASQANEFVEPPVLQAATFGAQGVKVFVVFDRPTDFAASVFGRRIYQSWRCNRILSFTGDGTAACVWLNSTTIVITQRYYMNSGAYLKPRDIIVTLSGAIKRSCLSTQCSQLPTSNGSSIAISQPASPIKPNIVLVAPDEVSVCGNVTLDASLSSGHASAPWASVLWTVSASDGGDVSHISAVLNQHHDISYPITLPAGLLRATRYIVTLGLRNILEAPGSDITTKTVSIIVRPDLEWWQVAVSSPPYIEVLSSGSVRLLASATLTSCNSSSIRQPFQVSYVWKVYRDYTLDRSPPLNAARGPLYLAPASSFVAGVPYQLVVTSTMNGVGTSMVSSKSVTVMVLRPVVRSIISGGLSRASHFVDDSLTLDGAGSRGPNLAYWWGCVVVSGDMYGTDCLSTSVSTSSRRQAVLFLESGRLMVGLTYKFSLAVSSGPVSDTSSVTITVQNASRAHTSVTLSQSVSTLFNARQKLKVSGYILSDTPGGVYAYWSALALGEPVAIESTFRPLSPLNRHFSHSQASAGVIFAFGLSAYNCQPGVTYTFRLTVEGTEYLSTTVDIDVTPNFPPSGGYLSVTPAEGTSYVTQFLFSAMSWSDDIDDYPLSYLFVYQRREVFDASLLYSRASSVDYSPFSRLSLPVGSPRLQRMACGVFVYDAWGADEVSVDYVTVRAGVAFTFRRRLIDMVEADNGVTRELTPADSVFIRKQAMESITEELDASLSVASATQALRVFEDAVAFLNMLSQPNCSWAPACESLYREECAGTSHTCGPCRNGFIGVAGDSNIPCSLASEESLPNGDACTEDSHCLSGFCSDDSVCAEPVKVCPLGQVNGKICSGNGVCSYVNMYGSPVQESDCIASNKGCEARCLCGVDYGGDDCGVSAVHLASRDSFRGHLCSKLTELTSLMSLEDEKIQTQSDYLYLIYSATEIISAVSMSKCAGALSTLADMMVEYEFSTPRLFSQNADIIAMFSRSGFDTTASVVTALHALQWYVHSDMIAGQLPVEVVSSHFRASYHYDFLNDLRAANLSIPVLPSDTREMPSVILPDSGLGMCGGFDNYAKLVVSLWSGNPYGGGVLNGSSGLLEVQVYPTLDSPAIINGDNAEYQMWLPFADSIDLTSQYPVCYQLNVDTEQVSECTECSVTSHTTHAAKITCSNTVETLCPTSYTPDIQSLAITAASDDRRVYFVSVQASTLAYTANYPSDESTAANQPLLLLLLAVLAITSVMCGCLCYCDRADRLEFIARRNHVISSGGMRFNIETAFDTSGTPPPSAMATPPPEKGRATSKRISRFSFVNPFARPLELSDALSTHTGVKGNSAEGEDKWGEFPVTSLLSNFSLSTRVGHALSRHHKWIRIFTYPSMRLPRFVRFLVALNDIIFILFAVAVLFGVLFPYDNSCLRHSGRGESDCLSEKLIFGMGGSVCDWNESDGTCSFRLPSTSITFVMTLSAAIVMLVCVPRTIIQFILENVCTKRPLLEDVVLNTDMWQANEPVPLADELSLRGKREGHYHLEKPHDKGGRLQTTAGVVKRKQAEAAVSPLSGYRYPLAIHDNVPLAEELEAITTAATNFCHDTMELMPLSRNESADAHSEHEARQVASMHATTRLLNARIDGTPNGLTMRQRLLFGSTEDWMLWKLKKARRECSALTLLLSHPSNGGPDQVDFCDSKLLQHFILEQLSPLTRVAIKEDCFQMDHATPGRIAMSSWLAACACVVGCWGFMSYWVVTWALTHDKDVNRSWPLVFCLTVFVDVVLSPLTQIVYLKVHMVEALRPQLRVIYQVLVEILQFRLLKHIRPPDSVRAVQHLSAACRCSRVRGVSFLPAAALLALVDDVDIARCREHRMQSLSEVGPLLYSSLFRPPILAKGYDTSRAAWFDVLVSLTWYCFIYLNYTLADLSIFVLIGVYGATGVAMALMFASRSRVSVDGTVQHSNASGRTTSVLSPSSGKSSHAGDLRSDDPHCSGPHSSPETSQSANAHGIGMLEIFIDGSAASGSTGSEDPGSKHKRESAAPDTTALFGTDEDFGDTSPVFHGVRSTALFRKVRRDCPTAAGHDQMIAIVEEDGGDADCHDGTPDSGGNTFALDVIADSMSTLCDDGIFLSGEGTTSDDAQDACLDAQDSTIATVAVSADNEFRL